MRANNLWVDESKEVAEKPSVDGAQVPKLTVETIDNHVYYYADVDPDRCLALIRTIRELDGRLRNERSSRSLPSAHPMTPIWLHIHSYGGQLFAGLGMADQLATIESPVFSIIEGVCASAATMISMACQHRYIMPSSFMLIHQFTALTWGTYEQIKDDVKMYDMAMETLVRFYCRKSKLEEDNVREMLKHESWYNAEQCLKHGFVDEIWNGDISK